MFSDYFNFYKSFKVIKYIQLEFYISLSKCIKSKHHSEFPHSVLKDFDSKRRCFFKACTNWIDVLQQGRGEEYFSEIKSVTHLIKIPESSALQDSKQAEALPGKNLH